MVDEKLHELLSQLDVTTIQGISFKRGIFDFIVDTPKGRHVKQEEALRILTDDVTEEFLYGGAAGGAKSWTGCCWLMYMCLNYPNTRWFIGREELKRITESTLITFFKVANEYGIRNGIDFKYNGQKNFIRFKNGARIDLLELKFLPRDPVYERFGSTEYTGGWIEEGGEIDFGAYDVLKTRIGRQYNEKYGLIGKLFITCNPKKNWMYTTFYLPNKKGTLPPHMKYLAAFVQDNPHIDKGYLERLKRTKDKAKKERLLNGNWEYMMIQRRCVLTITSWPCSQTAMLSRLEKGSSYAMSRGSVRIRLE
ncbi:phage terminase large subunit [Olivibacter sp. 47]|uniref:phage terminase large subunit n=1 Tax=Olivibacter sp. 47 TaxID=3056486 RepID=UPI0025A45783|nr:phage terminase large subunit [Olivibacter sp. 47]MDM8174776.1 phage terminase large subunit [Olivibacter sp. 47]